MTDPEVAELELIERDLVENAPEFSFRQALRLLRSVVQRLWKKKEGSAATVWLRPDLSLEAPGSEIAYIERIDDGYIVTTTFFGLYGGASPLPAFYTEELIEAKREDRGGSQALLDIVHDRLYEAREQALEKYDGVEASVARHEKRFSDVLRSFIGLRDDAVSRSLPAADRMLRYIGLLGPMQRSAIGLQSLLRDALAPIPVAIDECVERLVRVPQASRLALGVQNNRLGDSAIVGTFVRDRGGRFRISIGPMDGQAFHGLVNDKEYWHWLVAVVALYVNAPLQCELELTLRPGAISTAVLGDPQQARLGETSWLVSSDSEALAATLQIT